MPNKTPDLIIVSAFGFIISGCENNDFFHKYIMKGLVLDAYKFVMNDNNE